MRPLRLLAAPRVVRARLSTGPFWWRALSTGLGAVGVAIVVAMSSPERASMAAPGDLDPTFGSGGKVITPIEPGMGTDYGFAMVVQGNGRIVVAGNCHDGTSRYDFCLARYTSSGALDAAFGTGGKVISPIGASGDYGLAMALQADGKIIVAGNCIAAGTYEFCLARYSSAGVLDPSFGSGGKVITAIGVGDDFGRAVAVQADGRIVVAGYCVGNSNKDFCLARYNSSGALDAGFGSGGKVVSSIGTQDDFTWAMTVQADGMILVAGACDGPNYVDFCLARYSSTGKLDAGFGSRAGTSRLGGRVMTPIGAWDDHGQAVVVQADGRIVVTGFCGNGGNNAEFCLARFTAAGFPDAGFGTGGKVISPIGTRDDFGYEVALQPDGKIIVAGWCVVSADDFCLARYTSAGVLDATFGSGGKITTTIGGADDRGRTVVVQADGRIIVAGSCSAAGGTDFCLARYAGDRRVFSPRRQ